MPLTQKEIDLDHTPLTFGKYQGRTPDDISEEDPAYIVWMFDNVTNKPTCSRTLREVCADDSSTFKQMQQKSDRSALTGRLSFDKDDLYE